MKIYIVNLLESFSQVLNAIHGGNPNQTFSDRLARKRTENPGRYWRAWIWSFETFWPGHLDWAMGPDDEIDN